jgi:hypothetical protein
LRSMRGAMTTITAFRIRVTKTSSYIFILVEVSF